MRCDQCIEADDVGLVEVEGPRNSEGVMSTPLLALGTPRRWRHSTTSTSLGAQYPNGCCGHCWAP